MRGCWGVLGSEVGFEFFSVRLQRLLRRHQNTHPTDPQPTPNRTPTGVLEAFSYVVRMFSGVISDHMRSRKAAIAAGFAMGAMAKCGMSFGTTVGQVRGRWG